jgi:glutamate synthase (ferredoxin)
MVFLPTDEADRQHCEGLFEQIIREEGQVFLGWRSVPTNNSDIGPTARTGEPVMRQVFIGSGPTASLPGNDDLALERRLYIIRKRIESAVRKSNLAQRDMFYVPSLSCKTLIYKGMLNSPQLGPYFPDLQDPDLTSALALVPRASAPTPSPPGPGLIPIATSATTARSILCAATSTGCAPARPCSAASSSAMTWPRSCP